MKSKEQLLINLTTGATPVPTPTALVIFGVKGVGKTGLVSRIRAPDDNYVYLSRKLVEDHFGGRPDITDKGLNWVLFTLMTQRYNLVLEVDLQFNVVEQISRVYFALLKELKAKGYRTIGFHLSCPASILMVRYPATQYMELDVSMSTMKSVFNNLKSMFSEYYEYQVLQTMGDYSLISSSTGNPHPHL